MHKIELFPLVSLAKIQRKEVKMPELEFDTTTTSNTNTNKNKAPQNLDPVK